MQALKGCLGEDVAPAVHGEVLRMVRASLQVGGSKVPRSQGVWGLNCVAALAPLSASNIHSWSAAEPDVQLSAVRTSVSILPGG